MSYIKKLYQEIEHEIDNIDTDELLLELLKEKYEEFKKEDPEMSADDLDLLVIDNVRSKLFFID